VGRVIPKTKKFVEASMPKVTGAELKAKFGHLGPPCSDEDWEAEARRLTNDPVFMNNTYQVQVSRRGDFVHVSIKRHDRLPIRDWRELQGIKNEILGPEWEAVELYPAESRLIDSANQYHLWAVNDPKFRFPFGFNERLVIDGSGEIEADGTRQEPLKKEEK